MVPDTVPFEAVYSGLLWRQSKYLKHWKRSFVVLWNSGLLKLYEDDDRGIVKNIIDLTCRPETIEVIGVERCAEVHPPPILFPTGCVFGIRTDRDGIHYLAADTSHDAQKWTHVLSDTITKWKRVNEMIETEDFYPYRKTSKDSLLSANSNRICHSNGFIHHPSSQDYRDPGMKPENGSWTYAMGATAGVLLCSGCWLPWFLGFL